MTTAENAQIVVEDFMRVLKVCSQAADRLYTDRTLSSYEPIIYALGLAMGSLYRATDLICDLAELQRHRVRGDDQ